MPKERSSITLKIKPTIQVFVIVFDYIGIFCFLPSVNSLDMSQLYIFKKFLVCISANHRYTSMTTYITIVNTEIPFGRVTARNEEATHDQVVIINNGTQ